MSRIAFSHTDDVKEQFERARLCVYDVTGDGHEHGEEGVDGSGFLLLQDLMELVCVLCRFHPYEHHNGRAGVLLVHGRVWHAHHHHVVFASSSAGHGGGHHDVQQDVP